MSFHAEGAAAAEADALGAADADVIAAAESVGIADADGIAEAVSGVAGVAGGVEPPPHATDKTGATHASAKAKRRSFVVMARGFTGPSFRPPTNRAEFSGF